ncbi:MaoC family dehydratase [Alloalcanivorax mobilis]|uniref:MaoC family dehydratase n=1 Tax=Alloalcanivorax mobilis TaxID=2019569 RepID=UPI000B5B1731|nr:MaoC family dehydratase [Alloalcanivorax mobilis]ASK33744.1 hypothetical protein CEK62_04740 [Alcanivorax sp. N3-2A]|tara:strand:+ start:1622 stop:2041 length:420 start_codon:yes stop_codon:yes gene_type:complete
MPHAPANPSPASGRVEVKRTLRQADFDRFARLSGDHNPIHVDPVFAAASRFGATVSHGMLLFSALRGLLSRHYPNARLDLQDVKFPAPAYADETLTLVLEPQGPAQDGELRLATHVIKADGRRCLEGHCRLTLTAEETP